MRRHQQELDQFGAAVAVVSFSPIEELRTFQAQVAPEWTYLHDPAMHAYRAYGLGRAGLTEIVRPDVMLKYLSLIARGRIPDRPTSDTAQLGGDFVVDPEGVLCLSHPSRHPADRPSIAEVLAALESPR